MTNWEELRQIRHEIWTAINEYTVQKLEKGPRSHMGASEIGHECWQYLWLKWRFCDYKKHDGRMLRLFNRGHQEEEKVKELLIGAGCEFVSQQDSFKAVGGHFAGSCDGVIKIPQMEKPILWECKTYGGEENDKKDFEKLYEQFGVKKAKPQHFAQISVYCKFFNLAYCLYTAIKKSTDEIYTEIIVPDIELANELVSKAEIIITSQEPFPKLNKDSTFFKCKYCDFVDVCHNKKPIFKCCRSCSHCVPDEDEKWVCTGYECEVPKEELGKETKCEHYNPIWKG